MLGTGLRALKLTFRSSVFFAPGSVVLGSIILVSIISGCGGGDNPDRNADRQAAAAGLSLTDQGYTILYGDENATLVREPNLLAGDGAVEFLSQNTSVDEDSAYAIEFALPQVDSQLIIWMSAKSGTRPSALDDTAIAFRFRQDGGRIRMDLWNRFAWVGTADSTESTPWQATGRHSVVLDVHNGETPAHLLVWPLSKSYEGQALSPQQAWFNSAEMSLDPAPRPEDFHPFEGSGQGHKWGLAVQRGAQVFRIQKSPPAWEH